MWTASTTRSRTSASISGGRSAPARSPARWPRPRGRTGTRRWEREGRIVVCPWHSLEFDITTGQCLAYPRVKLRRYPGDSRGGHREGACMSDPIIDVDLHLAETAADLAPYTDPALASGGRGTDGESAVVDLRGAPSAADSAGGARRARRYAAALIAHLDDAGIAAGILLPGPLLKIGLLPTAAYAAALARAYNRWLASDWLGRPGRPVYGAILAAPQEPADAARRDRARTPATKWIAGVLLPIGRYRSAAGATGATTRSTRRRRRRTCRSPPRRRPAACSCPARRSRQLAVRQNGFEQQAISQPLVATGHLVSMVGHGRLRALSGPAGALPRRGPLLVHAHHVADG